MEFTETWSLDLTILVRCLVALVLGGVIGWERESAGKFAGLRTHMLVCLAAMLFGSTAIIMAQRFPHLSAPGTLRTDPIRLTEAIATGISFIGAGAVFRDRTGHRAQGLTTAATLLTVGPIGISIAMDHFILAAGATLLVFIVLRVIGSLEKGWHSSGPPAPGPQKHPGERSEHLL